ncbi:hypothetical protein [uncultured Nocardioides sp.]|uniref:hypothetical protein n=1 Tax=uncultured Nocardioides sp. TaxID=198441 RepID=UPI002614C6D9|nr:hypothetical protein [uncultured Nocardioides sp.]
MALIIGDRADPHVQAVVNFLNSTATIVDGRSLLNERYSLTDTGFVFGSKEFAVSSLENGWVRRLAPAGWGRGDRVGSHSSAVRASALALLAGVMRLPGIAWLTHIDALMVAESKLVQSRVARAIGVGYPKTVVTNDLSQARRLLGAKVVVKPLGPGQFTRSDGSEASVLANMINLDDPIYAGAASTPFIIQEPIDVDVHYRVVTVSDRSWVCELPARGRPFDWRSEDESHNSFEVTTNAPPNLWGQALDLAAALSLGFTSQDWVKASGTGDLYVLDVNPGGQWLFLPEPVASQVAESIARWLEGRRLLDGFGRSGSR